MTSRAVDPATDPVRPGPSRPVRISLDGTDLVGIEGQSIAAVLLSHGIASWRTTPGGRQRGVFCGIGVCFDCVAEVNGRRDVRTCQRRAHDGDTVTTQDDRDAS